MKEIKLNTNLHCSNCVAKLGKVLDTKPHIHHWKADVSTEDKTVTVHGDVTKEQVAFWITEAGFSVKEKEPFLDMIASTPHHKQESGFWKDNATWRRAAFNTVNCLIGCTIGDFAMVVYLQAFHPHISMGLQMLLSTIAGLITSVLLESTIMHYREKFQWSSAFKMAISMSFISMIAMELAMNTTDFMITGGKAQLGSPLYWMAFIPAAIAGFLTPLPYNYYNLKKHNRACH